MNTLDLKITTKTKPNPGDAGFTSVAQCKTELWGLVVRDRTGPTASGAERAARGAVLEALYLALFGLGPMDPPPGFASPKLSSKFGHVIERYAREEHERRRDADDEAADRALIKSGASGDDVLRAVARRLIAEGVKTDGIVSVSVRTFKRLAKEVL